MVSSDTDIDTDALAGLLGHVFDDPQILRRALTHPSVDGQDNYQRLEFLGDRVLGVVIASRLFRDFPEVDEGELALRYNDLVRKSTLATIAQSLDLGRHVLLSPGEDDSGGRDKPAILADICEALIGALYLDGGFDVARRFVLDHWTDLVDAAANTEKDGKTRLQEWGQARGFAPPKYREISREGPPHAPIFTIEAVLGNGMSATGQARSKRGAEQEAAEAVLAMIEDEGA